MTGGPLVSRALLAVAVVSIAILSLLPPDRLPGEVAVSDKLLHALAYGVLAVLAVSSGLGPAAAFIAVVIFGLLLEVAQLLSGYRAFEWRDLLADALGATLGIALVVVLRRVRARSGTV